MVMASSFVFLIILCFAPVCLSNALHHDNPIRLGLDGIREMESSALPMVDDDDVVDDDDLSYARLTSHSIEAIYQFGDSLSDTGNFAYENPYSTFNQFPYGETYFHKPTGRCSDGLLMIDYFAKFLKLPFLDAYLNKEGNFTHGVNFAVTGATALNVSTLRAKHITPTVTNHSLSVQLDWFKTHLNNICSNTTSECKTEVAKALFVMGEVGGNDYNFAIFEGKPILDVYEIVPEVVQAITNAVEEVIGLGATKVAVPGNFPIGCMSVYLAVFKTNDTTMYDNLKCIKPLNKFAKFHNDLLRKSIKKLRKNHPHSTIVYMDYAKALRKILQHSSSFGFDREVVQKTCCGSGDNDYNFDFGKSCGIDGVPVCENPKNRVNWDGYHLTQHAYQVMAKWLIRKTFDGISNVS